MAKRNVHRTIKIFSGNVHTSTMEQTIYTYDEPVSRSKNSVDTGGFTPGEWRINPYSISESAYHCDGPDQVSYWYGNYYPSRYEFTVTGHLSSYGYAYLAGIVSDVNVKPYPDKGPLALQKAMAKVGQSQLQLAVELGELKETLQMLRSPFKNFRSFLLENRGARLGFLKTAIRASKSSRGRRYLRNEGLKAGSTFAHTWLEFRYGLRPLVSSIEDILKEVHSKRLVFDANKVRTAKAQIIGPEQKDTRTFVLNLGDWTVDLRGTVKRHQKFNASVGYKRRWEQTDAARWMLSPEYIPEIIWELTRLSFVADWIFTIGPWLASYRVKPGIDILGNTVGRKTVVEGIGAYSNLRSSSEYWVHEVTGSVSNLNYYDESYNRTCNEDLSATPLLDVDIDLFKTIDSLSLIWQPLVRRLRK